MILNKFNIQLSYNCPIIKYFKKTLIINFNIFKFKRICVKIINYFNFIYLIKIYIYNNK